MPKVSVLDKISEENTVLEEKIKVARKKNIKIEDKKNIQIEDKKKTRKSKTSSKDIIQDNNEVTNIIESKQKNNDNIDNKDLTSLLNPTNHDLTKEKDIYIDISKILKYTPLTIEGKTLDDLHNVLYAVPYGPNKSDYDILTYSELQTMINAQIIENNIKIHRKCLRTSEGQDIMNRSQDIITRHKLHAWSLLSS
jgi:hypothetical protein